MYKSFLRVGSRCTPLHTRQTLGRALVRGKHNKIAHLHVRWPIGVRNSISQQACHMQFMSTTHDHYMQSPSASCATVRAAQSPCTSHLVRAYITLSAMSCPLRGSMPSYTASARSTSPLKRTTLNSVLTAPGAMLLTRTFVPTSSCRVAVVYASNANFDPQYNPPPACSSIGVGGGLNAARALL